MRLVFTIGFDSWAALHAVCRLLKCCEQDFGQLVLSLQFHGASISFFFVCCQNIKSMQALTCPVS